MVSERKYQCIVMAMLFLLATLPSQSASRPLNNASVLFETHEQWMARYGRVYEHTDEKIKRSNIFAENVKYIHSFNKANNKPYKLGINEFADLTNEEFKTSITRFNSGMALVRPQAMVVFKYENVTAVPSEVDWRNKGAVTPIKKQSPCAACWAFSAVAALEGLTKIKTGNLISLSEQELVDCDTNGENKGCNGLGNMNAAFDYIIKNHGLSTEADYPYHGPNGTCNATKEANNATIITGHEDVPVDEGSLLKAVANQPVSVGIDAGSYDFQLYASGVFIGDCSTNANHAVTAVGYGNDPIDGIDYWLVKNSWGPSWGEEGYIKMRRGVEAVEGLCGIAMYASYPIA